MHELAAVATLVVLSIAPAYAESPETIVLDVQNMACSLCPITVTNAGFPSTVHK
ncbi:MAG: hypothetical protein ABI728_03905 [Betaproteobacteria bacterium]